MTFNLFRGRWSLGCGKPVQAKRVLAWLQYGVWFGTRPQGADDGVYVACIVSEVCGLGHSHSLTVHQYLIWRLELISTGIHCIHTH